jgi:hypothetical protein
MGSKEERRGPMVRSPRAGKEPAEDLKRRMTEACDAVGWVVGHASVRLLPDRSARAILVEAGPPDWTFDLKPLELLAVMDLGGNVVRGVRILCSADPGEPLKGTYTAARVSGREEVNAADIAAAVGATVEERATVLALLAQGRRPPFEFTNSRWAVPDFGVGLAGA